MNHYIDTVYFKHPCESIAQYNRRIEKYHADRDRARERDLAVERMCTLSNGSEDLTAALVIGSLALGIALLALAFSVAALIV